MDDRKAEELLNRYLAGTCTPEEKKLLHEAFLRLPRLPIPPHTDVQYTDWKADTWRRLQKELRPKPTSNQSKTRKLTSLIKYAAAVILLGSCIGSFYMIRHHIEKPTQTTYSNDIAPGGNKAFLTLADGSRIELADISEGILDIENGVEISKNADGQVVYLVKESNSPDTPIGYNTIQTPKGGQYQVYLPDGTKVWLNAASSLRYPVNFAKVKERRVELTGEAYFEVAENKDKPFRIQTHYQKVEVLGTHFNIDSYPDEPSERTTLVEGAVKITMGNYTKYLKPGQQATVQDNIQITEADVTAALAWKNGMFVFNDEPLESIMRKVSRWYNVEIIYQGVDKNDPFWGSFSRYEHVSSVLRKLELTGNIHFEIKGRRIIVKK